MHFEPSVENAGRFQLRLRLNSALKSGLVGLAIILVLNSAVGAYYYLCIIVMMYMREPRGDVPVTAPPPAAVLAMTVCVLATLYLGVFPGRVLDFTAQSAHQLVTITTSPTASSLGQ